MTVIIDITPAVQETILAVVCVINFGIALCSIIKK